MTQHTPTPWAVDRRTDKRYRMKIVAPSIATRGRPVPAVATVHTPRSWNEADANAERIVACVNACEEINPEAVPEMFKALRDVAADSDGMTLMPDGLADRVRTAIANAEVRP